MFKSCLFCYQSIALCETVCLDCHDSLPWHHGCVRCGGVLLHHEDHTAYCKTCLTTPPPYQHLVSVWRYGFPIQHAIHEYKFEHQHHWQRYFKQQLFNAVLAQASQPLPELILPVPLHRKRLRQRGYNQSLLLARPLAKQLGLLCPHRWVKRVRHTQPQAELKAMQRRSNVKQAFMSKLEVAGKSIAIVDDIVTTGNTVGQLTQCLLDAGAGNVQVWCLAKT